jgi:DNA modification methylase
MDLNKIYNENCLIGMKKLPEQSINCCVTSPPYYGLRDYGNDEQIGLEETPEHYVQTMVNVFRDVKRVLRDDGTLWLNLGDSYAGGGKKGDTEGAKQKTSKGATWGTNDRLATLKSKINGVKPKDLIGIPWMVAFALRADGWYLRQDIIWNKPNPMPESVKDRCTKAHEYIFLLSKSPKYYYDSEAIKTESIEPDDDRGSRGNRKRFPTDKINGIRNSGVYPMANKRSVWTVNTMPYSEAHFATFPQELIVDCIKAGCPENGVVLDPFMGAGTTAVVSRKLNRNYLGFELNPDYVKIANNRLYNEMGMFL